MQLRELIMGKLKTPSDRDKQRLIGPSLIGSPCTRCVAGGLAGENSNDGVKPYWMGARLGTAIHNELETLMADVPGAVVEQRNVIGHLDGYGTISGSTDLFLDGVVCDYKTTTRTKMANYKDVTAHEPDDNDPGVLKTARFTIQTYVGQTHLYGLGWELLGHEVKELSNLFLCRDGVGDGDIWEYKYQYSPEYARKVWNRLEKIWEYLQNGRELDTFTSSPYCYTCNFNR